MVIPLLLDNIMKKIGLSVLLGSALLFAGCGLIPSHHGRQLHVKLTGAQEVPANDSYLKGDFVINLQDREYLLEVDQTIDPRHIARAAHLHCGKVGTNGGVVYGLAVDQNSWQRIQGRYVLTGIVDDAKFSTVPCPTAPIRNFDELRQAINDGNIYVNIHTQALPGGEIRAQVLRKP
jgi:hypothetical protein